MRWQRLVSKACREASAPFTGSTWRRAFTAVLRLRYYNRHERPAVCGTRQGAWGPRLLTGLGHKVEFLAMARANPTCKLPKLGNALANGETERRNSKKYWRHYQSWQAPRRQLTSSSLEGGLTTFLFSFGKEGLDRG